MISTILTAVYFAVIGIIGLGFLYLTGWMESFINVLFIKPVEKVISLFRSQK